MALLLRLEAKRIWQQPAAKLSHRGWIPILIFFKLIDSVSQILDRRLLALKRVRWFECVLAIDARTTRHAGYAVSQKKRKRIEECFGWLKDIALLRKLREGPKKEKSKKR
jgi:hypothetical protein